MIKITQVTNPPWTEKNIQHFEAHAKAYGDLGLDVPLLKQMLADGKAEPRMWTSEQVIAFEVNDDSTDEYLGDVVLQKVDSDIHPDAWELDVAIFDDAPDGVGTEAVSLLKNILPSMGITNIEGLVRAENPNKARIVAWLKKLGFSERPDLSTNNVISFWMVL